MARVSKKRQAAMRQESKVAAMERKREKFREVLRITYGPLSKIAP